MGKVAEDIKIWSLQMDWKGLRKCDVSLHLYTRLSRHYWHNNNYLSIHVDI